MEKLIASLTITERKVLPAVTDGVRVDTLADKLGLAPVEVMRAAQFLSNKELVTLQKESSTETVLSERGKIAQRDGLPEKQFYDSLTNGKTMDELRKQFPEDFNISFGTLKKQGAISIEQGIIKKTGTEPVFSEIIQALKDPAGASEHTKKTLQKRGLATTEERTNHTIRLTTKGKNLQKKDLGDHNYLERITPNMLRSGKWKNKAFRRYDVTSPVPTKNYGRKHFVNEAISNIKQLWVEMGFKEMTGTMTQTAFWDLDALFVPQDHPARDMQDTFYLPYKGELPTWWKEIQELHENGGNTGSKGWNYEYSEEEAKKVLLRTHTTVLSAQMLKQLKPEDLPGKFFSISRVFRNETLDWKHLAEFHQVEGIVVDPEVSLADLIGLQKEFYKKMGFEKIRFRPWYFPYTEPSCEVEAWHPVRKEWIEIGGMGVFRPEVVKPLLGKDIPVLAWGLGMERIITDFYGITDLRDIYSNDLEKLRTIKKFMRND